MKNLDQDTLHTLKAHAKAIAKHSLQELFDADPTRYDHFHCQCGGLLLDYSKNWIVPQTLAQLTGVAERMSLSERIHGLFSGQPINHTEQRAALHTVLRQQDHSPVWVNQHNVIPEVQAQLQKMQDYVTHCPYTEIVNLGIGGSHLGSTMVIRALRAFQRPGINLHFISGLDEAALHDTLSQLDPQKTLVIVTSKSFTTLETLTNAQHAKQWLASHLPANEAAQHMVAVTAKKSQAQQFGISPEHIFEFWDWVGGRYSLWSSVGLPIALSLGFPQFNALLQGAEAMDQHFRNAPLQHNMPVILALLGIWYINFFDSKSHGVFPYDDALALFPNYLQQTDMESNGKSIDRFGDPVHYPTGPIVWGKSGINAQHAFHQLLLQGTHLVPVDFIVALRSQTDHHAQQRLLYAACVAQSQALMQGKTLAVVEHELFEAGLTPEAIKALAPFKTVSGNQPSNTLVMDRLTPFNLGSLIALYEHKIFVQGVIWDINSFDQWGVELSKQLARKILPDLSTQTPLKAHDASTKALIQHFREHNPLHEQTQETSSERRIEE